MISITYEQVTPRLLSLFDLTKPTMLRAFNVLEGLNRGHILVDDPLQPTWAVIRDAIYGTLYFGGQVDADLVASLVSHFRPIGEVGIGCWLDDPLNDMIPSNPEYDGHSLFFSEHSWTATSEPSLPAEYRLAIRDRELLKQSFDYESTVNAFGTEENVMRYAFGVAILYEDKVVCEAATGAPTHGQIEIGVTTHESHRQRGLAFIACTRLIQICETQGLSTWWDCAKQNTASRQLAYKLGFHNEKEYRYVWWSKSP